MNTVPNRRILLVDDMPAIHDDFRKILAGERASLGLDGMEAALYGTPAQTNQAGFELDSAYQGREALELVEQALQARRPFAMAFVDMRMPPGWDGMETIARLWRQDPQLQVVLCTAYSDRPWVEVLDRLGGGDRLLILKKPFDPIEVRQLANMLTSKWDLARQAAFKLESLEATVQARTREIFQTNQVLHAEIVERKQLETRLVQSEKLAAIGQLAAGVAHEINNPLGYIFSNIGTLEQYVLALFEMLAAYEDAEPGLGSARIALDLKRLRERLELAYLKQDIPHLLQESKGGLQRVSKIIQDLKDFSRVDSDRQWEWADLHRGIDSTLNIIDSEIKYKADVIKEYGPLPAIECLPSELNQVFMNLLINAVQASGPRRGRITIRSAVEGEWIWIEIADRGCGIAPQALPRIFDPFFTTKPIGRGTGLGLSLSYGIVQKHHGRIEVGTELGVGTTFRVTLPIKHVASEGQV